MAPLTMADTQNGYFITCFQCSHKTDSSLAVGSELCVLCILYENEKEIFFIIQFFLFILIFYIKTQGKLHKMQRM